MTVGPCMPAPIGCACHIGVPAQTISCAKTGAIRCSSVIIRFNCVDSIQDVKDIERPRGISHYNRPHNISFLCPTCIIIDRRSFPISFLCPRCSVVIPGYTEYSSIAPGNSSIGISFDKQRNGSRTTTGNGVAKAGGYAGVGRK